MGHPSLLGEQNLTLNRGTRRERRLEAAREPPVTVAARRRSVLEPSQDAAGTQPGHQPGPEPASSALLSATDWCPRMAIEINDQEGDWPS